MGASGLRGRQLVVDRGVECPLRDGTVLRADVYRPARGQWPVLVHRTPYSKDHPMGVTNLMLQPLLAAERGYAVVVQDTRGRFTSDGLWTPLHCEAADGYDTVEWAAAQPWSTGGVGVYGSSYMGVTALQAVAAAPPHLVAAAAYLTGGNYHEGWVYTGGAFELLFNLRWAAAQALPEIDRYELAPDEHAAAVARLRWIAAEPAAAMQETPLADVFGPAEPAVPYWREWLAHSRYDDFWAAVDLTRALQSSRIPVLNIGGWYDGFLKGQLQAYTALRQAADVRHELIVGPWDHESYQGMRPNAAGDAFFGLDAVSGAAGVSGRVLDWFDQWLRPPESPPASGPAVRYFHMGPDVWQEAEQWPPDDSSARLWLASGGDANSRLGDGRLTSEVPDVNSVDSFIYDPRDPVPTCGGRHLGYWYGRAGVQDQATLELRPDVLVYSGPRLTEPVDVVGAVWARLYVRSSAPSTDFTVKLVDARPDGYCANVCEGIIRTKAVNGALSDTAAPLDIDLWSTAYRFERGSQIRVEVSSSNFPRFDRNGNLPAEPATTKESDWVPAVQQVLSGPAHPSFISLGGGPPAAAPQP